jgi:hypothetical protein
MSGYLNKDNCHFWAPNNPYELHQLFPHHAKVAVWCAISSHGNIGPYFFENVEGHTVTVNAEQYKVMLEQSL